jgi:hypothetical protein
LNMLMIPSVMMRSDVRPGYFRCRRSGYSRHSHVAKRCAGDFRLINLQFAMADDSKASIFAKT